MMKIKALALLNFISVFITLFVSYFTQTIKLNGNTIGSLSREYFNLFTPADYAFAIWGLIYVGLLLFSGYQLYQAFGPKRNLKFIEQTKYWFFTANMANALWVIVWLYEYTGLSVLFMLLILFSLMKIVWHTNMERWDAPLRIIVFCWWPICLYSGWIAVATLANISAYLAKMQWYDGAFFSEENWTIVMISVATILNIFMIYTRNMREFAAVGIWALVAIYIRHAETINSIAYTALSGAILIGLNAGYHGFKNRKANPIYRIFK